MAEEPRARVSVVMLTHNELVHLDESLSSLHDQSRPADEVIVVDNASTDGSVEFVQRRFPDVRLLANRDNVGFARGNNLGARCATGDYVVFINNDVRLDRLWLEELVRPLETNPDLVACQSLVLLYNEPERINTSGTTVNFLGVGWCRDYRRPRDSTLSLEVPTVSGAAFAIRRDVFVANGGFDESYFIYHEDIDLSWRLRLQGHQLALAPRSIVYHKYRFTRHARKYYLLERNRIMTLIKNYRLPTLLLITPAFLLTEVGICVLALRQGWLRPKLAGYRDLIRSLPALAGKRREVQRRRRLPDRLMKTWMVGTIDFEEINHPLVRLGGRILTGYWTAVRPLIVW
ncbi:MAG TPA: glycosyltransferase family 2 protein [Candidatus Dormibacteraeota bacterium]|nr:glycosyltransferase family 2 protein [Candidatus Dormibacteraeota bacterium]